MSNAHPFEIAGLGIAPFKFVGHHESKHQACPGAPIQAGSSCDYCGTSIMQVYTIRSADGHEFKVGSECVTKTEDRGLIGAVKKVKAVGAKVKRDAAAASRRSAAKEARDANNAARAEKAAADRETFADVLVKLDMLTMESKDGWVMRTSMDMANRARAGYGLSEKTLALVAKMWAAHTATSTLSHVGTVGKRMNLSLTMTHVHSYRVAGRYGADEARYVISFKDATGNALVWFTSAAPVHRPGDGPIAVTVRATIKEHGEHKGAPQTSIERAVIKYPAGMPQTWDEKFAADHAAVLAKHAAYEAEHATA